MHSGRAATSALITLTGCLAGGLWLAACSSGNNGSAPRVSTIPAQQSGGGVFTLDLASYVSDRESALGDLAYEVISGGGSISGTVYSNTFDTMGTWPVQVKISDPAGQSATASFDVVVTGATFAVLREGNDLRLLDTATNAFLTVATAGSYQHPVCAVLPRGHVVYERQIGGDSDLYVYEPLTRRTTTLGNDPAKEERYAAHTADGKVVFTTGTASDTDLFLYDTRTGLTRPISTTTGEHDRHAFVNGADLVFYERGSGGQADVWYYDPATDASTAVSTAATDERIRAVLPDGAIVFTRVGGNGELDLFWFARGTGLVEIGGDLSSTVLGQTKTYAGVTSTGIVVFQVTAATSQDLYAWNPAAGQSRAIGTSGVDETFMAVTGADTIVYEVATGASNHDLYVYDWTANASAAISATGDDERFDAALANGDVVYSRTTSGVDLYYYDASATTSAVIGMSGSSNYTLDRVLVNGKVVYSVGGTVLLYDPVGASSVTVAGNSTFGGESGNGDFVISTTANGQSDLWLWDESASTTVGISVVNGEEAFQAALPMGKVLFTRVMDGKTTADLFVWDPAMGVVTQLTNVMVNEAVVAVYAASAI